MSLPATAPSKPKGDKFISNLPGLLVPLASERVGIVAAGFGAAAFVLTTVLDWFLLRMERWHPLAATAMSNTIFAVLVILLTWELLRYNQQRQAQVVHRLETINEMNHHIRNALQVISFNLRPSAHNASDLAEINQALNRVQWALREILPKLEPHFTPFEGSARLHRESQEALNDKGQEFSKG
ncbi:MAG: hypothetical protein ACE14M_04195 [Terriglobales bacterium]